MAKSIKFKNEKYLDSSGIIHNGQTLKNILQNGRVTNTYLQQYNSWDECLKNMTDLGINCTQVYTEAFNCKGAPINAYKWGLLISIKNNSYSMQYQNIQIYIPDNLYENPYYIYLRTFNPNRVGFWTRIKCNSDVINAYGYTT